MAFIANLEISNKDFEAEIIECHVAHPMTASNTFLAKIAAKYSEHLNSSGVSPNYYNPLTPELL